MLKTSVWITNAWGASPSAPTLRSFRRLLWKASHTLVALLTLTPSLIAVRRRDLAAGALVKKQVRQFETTRSRLYRRRFWPPNSRFSAFLEIYKIVTLLQRSELNILEKIIQNFQKFHKIFRIF